MPGMCSKNPIIKHPGCPFITCYVMKKNLKFVHNVKNFLAQNLRGGIEVIHLTFLSFIFKNIVNLQFKKIR
jgi:hypothetical protein